MEIVILVIVFVVGAIFALAFLVFSLLWVFIKIGIYFFLWPALVVGFGYVFALRNGRLVGLATAVGLAGMIALAGYAFNAREASRCEADIANLLLRPPVKNLTRRLSFAVAPSGSPVHVVDSRIRIDVLQPNRVTVDRTYAFTNRNWMPTSDPICPHRMLSQGLALRISQSALFDKSGVCLNEAQFAQLQQLDISVLVSGPAEHDEVHAVAQLENGNHHVGDDKIAIMRRQSIWFGFPFSTLFPRSCTSKVIRLDRYMGFRVGPPPMPSNEELALAIGVRSVLQPH